METAEKRRKRGDIRVTVQSWFEALKCGVGTSLGEKLDDVDCLLD
jgi:hypothetical protein